jgi:hypothetical protein
MNAIRSFRRPVVLDLEGAEQMLFTLQPFQRLGNQAHGNAIDEQIATCFAAAEWSPAVRARNRFEAHNFSYRATILLQGEHRRKNSYAIS